MNYQKKSLIHRIAFACVNLLLLLTMFLPTISIDKYVEYDFTDGYYNENYESHIEPIATKITPYMFISSLFADRSDYINIINEYNPVIDKYKNDLNSGKISYQEYISEVSKNPTINKYNIYAIKFKSHSTLDRLEPKIFMFSCVITAFYAVTALMLIVNIINCFNKKKLLSIANIYGAWVQTVLCLAVQIFTFSFAISSQNVIGNIVNDTLTEEITYAATPKFLSIFILLVLFVYATIVTILDKQDTKIEKQNKEIPKFMSEQIQNKNKYRKINSKKSKYKYGSKKKHHH